MSNAVQKALEQGRGRSWEFDADGVRIPLNRPEFPDFKAMQAAIGKCQDEGGEPSDLAAIQLAVFADCCLEDAEELIALYPAIIHKVNEVAGNLGPSPQEQEDLDPT